MEPKKQTRRRTALWIIGGLLGFLVLVPQLVISLWGADLLSGALTKELTKPVSVQQVSGGWWGGVEIEGLTISDSFDTGAKTLLKLGRVSLSAPIWMLVLPFVPIDAVVDGARLELRFLADREWNVAALQPTADIEAPEQIPLPGGKLRFSLTRSQLYLEPEDREYSLTAQAASVSLRHQPMQWRIALSASDGESLAATGTFTNLATPKMLTGSAKVEMAGLDLAMIPALIPGLPLMHPDGTVETGTLQIRVAGLERFQAEATFDLRNISLPDIGQQAEVGLPRGSVRLAVTRNRDNWTVQTLSLESPHGNMTLEPGAWLEISEGAWQAKLALHAELGDTRPASRALTMLLPDPLSLAGALSIKASVDGRVSLDSQKDLHERMANLKASLDLTLAEARWRELPLKDIVAQVDLDHGRLSVAKLAAAVGKGRVDLQGELTVGANPGGGLSWLVTDVPLADALGAPVRTFDIVKATGRLTFDGEAYHLKSQTGVRELDFDPVALDNRELRLNNAKLDCAGTLAADLTRFNTTDCQLESVQGDLSSQKGSINLGPESSLTIDLDGWLGGPFLSALVPEVTPRWPARINVRGHLMVPFTGATWANMGWALDANGKKFSFQEEEFENLTARVTKAGARLDFNISGERGAGRLVTVGSLKLGEKDVSTLETKATRLPMRRKLPGTYSLEGTVSGSANVTIDAEGERAFLDNQLTEVKLHRGRELVASLASAELRGDLRRTQRSGLWAKNLSLVGPQLNLRIHDSHVPLEGRGKEALELNVDFTGESSWLALAAALSGADYVLAEGNGHLSLRFEGKPGRVLESIRGEGQLRVPRLSLWSHPLANLDAVFELHPDEIKITRGLVESGRGKIALEGNVLLPLDKGNQNEHLVLQLDQVPMTHTQTFSSFKAEGPARLENQAFINGRIALDGAANGQLTVTADIRTGPINRRLFRKDEDLASAKLPALHLESKLVSQKSLQEWTTPALSVRGKGVSIQLTDGQFLWKESTYDVAGSLAIEMSPEFLEAVSLGLLPPSIKPTGKITASGPAKVRVPLKGPIQPSDIEFNGPLNVDKLMINADTLSSLRLAIRLARGRLDVEQGEASLLGGRVWIPSPSGITLQGPAREFNVHMAAKDLELRTYGSRQVSLGRFLGLLIPVFLFKSDSNKPVRVTGVLQTDLQVAGTYQDAAGWSRSVNGKGAFRIDGGAVEGSSLISGILARSLLMPTNVVHNSVAALFSKDGQVGRALTGLGDRAFTFQTIDSPITIRNGEILLKKDLTVRSPELTLTINGHSNLEGELDYDVGTDLIRRVRLGEITDLPNQIPIIGKALSFLNPFTYLDGIELRARVTGNVLKTRADGQSDVQVKTSVVDTKRS